MRFDTVAGFYDFLPMVGDEERVVKLVAGPRNQRVLDLGGGTGRYSELFPGEVVVADVSKEMLLTASEKRPRLRLARSDAANLPFAPATFDAVVVTDAFHHFGDHAGVLREVGRVLKPDGSLVLQEFDVSRVAGKLVRFFERHVLRFHPLRMYGPTELAAFLENSGFEVSTYGGGPLTYVLEARKL